MAGVVSVGPDVSNSLKSTEEIGAGFKIDLDFDFGIDLDFDLDLSSPNALATFEQLSVANQIILLKHFKKYEGSHLFNNLNLSTQEIELKKNGFHKITYLNNDVPDVISQSFNDLWYSEDIYERIIARNLLKYEYIVNGFRVCD